MSTAVSSRARRWPWSPLTVRLMLAQTAVLAIGLIIVVITAVLIGPRMFYHELVESGFRHCSRHCRARRGGPRPARR